MITNFMHYKHQVIGVSFRCSMHVSVPLTLMYFVVGLLPPPFDDHHNQYHKENDE